MSIIEPSVTTSRISEGNFHIEVCSSELSLLKRVCLICVVQRTIIFSIEYSRDRESTRAIKVTSCPVKTYSF